MGKNYKIWQVYYEYSIATGKILATWYVPGEDNEGALERTENSEEFKKDKKRFGELELKTANEFKLSFAEDRKNFGIELKIIK